ncbi:hypothetical protein ABL78_4864 [Leptomonas seymouri]|uniref:DUF7920 domain-containing protein n=1 Tax=Leptomonas seymouri TaxID=5684 RepID=A0A0N1PAX9_LEPSE|nr:hypothetical protein ABL78_4864 [Leptomonas seymouri]|eukprot:KPI86062.1 hypothetical protein ABL78_4864 [Leptomonas seymouri]
MPRALHVSSPSTGARSPTSSLADAIYAKRITTPTFPLALRPPPPLTKPSGDVASHSDQPGSDAESSYHHRIHTSGSGGVNGLLSAYPPAFPSTGSADDYYTSLNHSFSHPPLGVTLDEEQRRCVNTAFHISFHGNPRVKHKTTCVDLPNGASFLVVDRFVSGNSDGVYAKNRKIWEQIPIGQARVFARAPRPLKYNCEATDSAGGDASGGYTGTQPGREAEPDEEAAAATTTTAEADQGSTPGPSSSRTFHRATRSPGVETATLFSSSPTPLTVSTAATGSALNANSEWTCVATAVGLRKMGHWREATTVYTNHKEVAKSSIAMEKVDGESGRLSAFTWMGERYWVVGCRCQHIVTRLTVPEADLACYVSATSAAASSASSEMSTEGMMSSASPVQSPTNHYAGSDENVHNSATRGHEQRSTHSSSATAVTTFTSGGLNSEAGYLDLALRMARLWRRVLEALPVEAVKETRESEEEGGREESRESPVEALHACIAAEKCTLCFDAILTGWERLQGFSALPSFIPHTSSTGTATPVSSSFSTVFSSSSSLATGTSEAEIPLWFYAITWDAPLDVRGWCMPVLRARDFFMKYHLPFVCASKPVELGSPEYEALRQSVLSRCDAAGAVLYGSNVGVGDDDGDAHAGMVVQVWKCRAYPHTLERVVQEYVVTHRLCGDPLRNKVKKKVSSMSRELRLSIKQWELHRLPFLVDFALWLHREKYITPSTDLAALKAIRSHWLSYQEKFKDVLLAQLQRQQQRLSIRLSSLSTHDISRKDERVGDDSADDAISEAASEEEDSVDPIMLVGPQGCGKSTMARTLYALLEEAGAAPRWFNQDEVGTRTAYLSAIRRAIARCAYSHILLDKMNLDDKARADYSDIGLKPVLVVAWKHANGTEAMVNACYNRVVQRGAGHRSFFHAETTKLGQNLSFSTSSLSPELQPSVTPPKEVGSSISSVSVPAAWLSRAASPINASSSPSSPTLSFSTSASALTASSSRLHGILEASAKRYQIPSSMPCVEVDITWDCRRAVEVVWEALREMGTCELPPLSELNVESALQTAYAYERLLVTYPNRIAAAVLRGPSGEEVLRQLGTSRPSNIPKALRLQLQVEVMLHDFQLNPSPTALVRYANQIGTTRQLAVLAVVSNSKVILLLMLGPSASVAAASVARENCGAAAMRGGDGIQSRMSSSTLGAGDAATMAPASSQVLEDYLESQTQQEQWAVVAKAKKVTAEYCETLAQRVRDDPEEDPYCAVHWLSPPLLMNFTVSFTFP